MGKPRLSSAATDRGMLLAQYSSAANLRSRVGIYDYLEPEAHGQPDFGDWVLDHVPWSGYETVLDVGCGGGANLPALAGRSRAAVAMDISTGMLADATELAGSSVVFVQADAARLPFRTSQFDVVLAAFMLYHVPNIEQAISEVARVLTPGGAYLVALNGATDKCELRDLWSRAADSLLGSGREIPNWSARANLDTVLKLLNRHFDEISVDRRPGRFRLPSAAPALAWMDSLRPGTEKSFSDPAWAAIRAWVERAIETDVKERGEFIVTKDSGVIVAASPLVP